MNFTEIAEMNGGTEMVVVTRKKNPTATFSGSKCIVLNNKDQGTVIAIGYGKARRKNSKRRKSSGTRQGLYERSQNEMNAKRNRRRKRKVSVAGATSENTYVSMRRERISAVGDVSGKQVKLIQ